MVYMKILENIWKSKGNSTGEYWVLAKLRGNQPHWVLFYLRILRGDLSCGPFEGGPTF
jgi:hypothetical protein